MDKLSEVFFVGLTLKKNPVSAFNVSVLIGLIEIHCQHVCKYWAAFLPGDHSKLHRELYSRKEFADVKPRDDVNFSSFYVDIRFL